MDSVTQFALGAAVATAALGTRTRARRALLWGGVVATLPDLDVLIDHGDAIRNMTGHRAESHALFYLTLAAPLIAFAIARLHGERNLFGRWCLAVWLALVTHPLLDAMTIYGTRLLLPFTDRAFALGSLFIIDPLYTLPLLVGCAAVWIGRGSARALRWNVAGLALSTLYAGWSVAAQQHALAVARACLVEQGVPADQVLATPAPFQTLLWRVVAVTPECAYEGHVSLWDTSSHVDFLRIERGTDLLAVLHSPAADQLAQFSQGYFKTWRDAERVRMADLRMGMEPYYYYTFVVGTAGGATTALDRPERDGTRPDADRALPWLWRRMWGEALPPPR